MAKGKTTRLFLVEADILPEVFLKVMEAKELLQTGEGATVGEAAARVGISRSAFYKYKDAVRPFRSMSTGSLVTFNMELRDRQGVLSSVLAIFAGNGANILTINQSIPSDGAALVVISASGGETGLSSEELLLRIRGVPGVIRADVLAG